MSFTEDIEVLDVIIRMYYNLNLAKIDLEGLKDEEIRDLMNISAHAIVTQISKNYKKYLLSNYLSSVGLSLYIFSRIAELMNSGAK